jgi:membrane-associated protease RseP (regulator of RpoE activity)
LPYRRFQHRWWRHILLFLLTVATTTDVGTSYYLSFLSELGTRAVRLDWTMVRHGMIYSAAVLGILGAHEMGHYLACRYYNLDATLPFFLPFPLLSISGTLGAVIKIKEPFPTRKALFDIAVAGPLAGFAVLVPLLFQLMAWLKFGSVGDQWQLNLHPIGFAAWFGMLATAWNLLPFGQLDGGHLAYATLGDRSRVLSFATVAASIGMCFVSKSWIVMTGMMLAMLYFFGPRHPPVMDEYEPLGRGRHAIAILAVVLFVLCFTPVPIDIVN